MKRMIRSISALSLLALAAAACAPANPMGPGPVASPSAPAGNQQPGQQPNQPGNEPSASPVDPQAGNGQVATLRGKVYDEKGAPVDGGQVTVKSLNPSAPFETTVEVKMGSYVANAVPAGVLLEVSAHKDGWTKRSRVVTLLGTNNDSGTTDFGGGNAYFISDYPEIAAVEPPLENGEIDGSKLLYKLTLSEALDETNRRRLENALRVLPANELARAGATGATVDLETQEDVYPLDRQIDGDNTIAPYAIQKGTTFMGDADKRAKVSWSADGLTATLEFDAPLVADDEEEAKYQLVLVSDGANNRILDKSGKQLGTNASGSLTAYPDQGDMILGAIQAPSLALKTITGLTAGSSEERWAATHRNVGAFEIKKDAADPALEGVAVSTVGAHTRLELTFSEPMAAYNGMAMGLYSNELVDPGNYTFAVGRNGADLEGIKLDGTPDLTVDATTATSFGASSERGKEFRFAGTAGTDLAAATTGQVVMQIDPMNAKRVFLYVANRAGFFDNEAAAIKARVVDVADPAGNAIAKSAADAGTKMGDI